MGEFCLFLFFLQYGIIFSSFLLLVESCSCRKSCLGQFDSTKDHFASIPSSSNSFYFDISLGSCVQLPSLCETNINCAFTSKAHCEASCGSEAKLGKFGASDIAKGGAKLSGCEATKFGCCPDGSARTESRSCRKCVGVTK